MRQFGTSATELWQEPTKPRRDDRFTAKIQCAGFAFSRQSNKKNMLQQVFVLCMRSGVNPLGRKSTNARSPLKNQQEGRRRHTPPTFWKNSPPRPVSLAAGGLGSRAVVCDPWYDAGGVGSAELWAFAMTFAGFIGPSTIHTGSMCIIDGLWSGEEGCMLLDQSREFADKVCREESGS